MKDATEDEIEKGIKSLNRILTQGRKQKKGKAITTLRLNDHKGRLDRQGKDIYTLWKKVEELERKEIKLLNMIKGLIRYLDLNFFTRLTEKGDEVKFEKRAKNNISEMYNKPGISDKRKRKVLEENIDCILNQIIRKRNENN